MSTRRIAINVEVPNTFAADVLTTAVEGGINYWCCADSIVRDDNLSVLKVIGPQDNEDNETRWDDITLDTIFLGIQRIISEAVPIRNDLFIQVLRGVMAAGNGDEFAAGEIDSDAADCVVQAGLFNELTYS